MNHLALSPKTINEDYETVAQSLRDNPVYDINKPTDIMVIAPQCGVTEPQLGASCGCMKDLMLNGEEAIPFGVYAGILEGFKGVKLQLEDSYKKMTGKTLTLGCVPMSMVEGVDKNIILVSYIA